MAVCMPALLHAQGVLTAYYASEDFGDYRKGQLIVDTNDPINRMVDYSQTKYKYEGDDSGEYYSKLILKSRVTAKQYMMTPLPIEKVQDDATFVSRNGFKVRIFAACANGHSFYSYSDDGEFMLLYNADETAAHQEYSVLSGQLESPTTLKRDSFLKIHSKWRMATSNSMLTVLRYFMSRLINQRMCVTGLINWVSWRRRG